MRAVAHERIVHGGPRRTGRSCEAEPFDRSKRMHIADFLCRSKCLPLRNVRAFRIRRADTWTDSGQAVAQPCEGADLATGS